MVLWFILYLYQRTFYLLSSIQLYLSSVNQILFFKYLFYSVYISNKDVSGWNWKKCNFLFFLCIFIDKHGKQQRVYISSVLLTFLVWAMTFVEWAVPSLTPSSYAHVNRPFSSEMSSGTPSSYAWVNRQFYPEMSSSRYRDV